MQKQKKRVLQSQYKFFVDLSGRVNKDDIYIGCILIPTRFRTAFLEQFYKDFPDLKSFEKKSKDLDKKRLKEVIDFMDSKRIKMCCFHLPDLHFKKNIDIALSEIRNIRGNPNHQIPQKNERLLSLPYYYVLRKHAWQNWHYDVECCAETQIKLIHLFTYLQRMSYKNDYNFHFSFNFRRHQHMLKFADFVAGAGKKLSSIYLNQLPYFEFLNHNVNIRDLYKVFSINKLKYKIKKRKFGQCPSSI